LRIVVGFKVTPDYEALRAPDWARAAGGAAESGGGPGAPETRYVRRVLGVFDEAALELALRLRDARAEAGLETSLAAFSVAAREADPFLQTLQALGFERAARVDPRAALDFAPRVTAAVIATYLRRIGSPDVLLLGSRCGPGESGAVPFLVADELGLPCVTEVTDVQIASRGRLRVTFAAGGGWIRATIAPPCVLAVGNAVVSMLRVPTLKDRLAVRERSLDVLSSGELGVDAAAALAGEPTVLASLETIDRERAGTIVAGRTPEEKARALYETQLRARLERL
jgi:electron transfer flavoprotein alpha/beta subunit